MKINLAIFASGNGTNTENIIRYFQGNETIRVGLIASNRADAYVLERARLHGIPSLVISRQEFAREGAVANLMRQHRIDYIILAGFLVLIPHSLLALYPKRILNIHPSLLPKFGGKGMYGDRVHEAVVAAGEKETGITIHYIDEHYDQGTQIFQATCPVLPTDTPHDVASKVHALEYQYYPMVIEQVIKEAAGNGQTQP